MSNKGEIAYLAGFKKVPLLVKRVDDERFPDDDEIVVKVAAVAINQVDVLQQDEPWTHFNYPLGLGEDVVGEVVDVGGSAEDRFKIGDRVLGHALVLQTVDERHAAFQNFSVIAANMASPIPPSLSYERAVVLPLAVSTAAAALFQKDAGLGLEYPSLNPTKTGKTILIWGGTSAVGGNAIQLAVAAGVEVIATCSPRSAETVRKLGASETVDYGSPTKVEQIQKLLENRTIVGAFDAIGRDEGSFNPTARAIVNATGSKRVVSTNEWIDEKFQVKGTEYKPIRAVAIRENEVGEKVYRDFLPKALEDSKYTIFPEPKVYTGGKGLGAIQGAFALAKNNSASKPVVFIE